VTLSREVLPLGRLADVQAGIWAFTSTDLARACGPAAARENLPIVFREAGWFTWAE
jgi:hypothetical protein